MLERILHNSNYDVYYYVLTMNRELYERLIKVDVSWKGLLDECIKLKEMNYHDIQSMQE